MRFPAAVTSRNWSQTLCIVALFASIAAGTHGFAADSALVVEAAAGAVKLRMADRWHTPVAGTVVVLPTVVSTGADGSARLRQNATMISVAANTAIELLAGPAEGQLVQRAVQNRGSAFYDIAPQGPDKFRVETPYLVAVIKGTQFNVSVSDDVASVSLFEGRLRIEAPDVGDAVDLVAGQIAQRRRGDPRITVLSMQDGNPVGRSDASKPGSSGPGIGDSDSSIVGVAVSPVDDTLSGDLEAEAGVVIGSSDADAELALDADGDEIGASADAEIGLDDTATAEVGLESELDLGDAEATIELDESAELGGSSIDIGADADLDSGIDLDLDLGADGELLDTDLGGDLLDDSGTDSGSDAETDDTDNLLSDPGDLIGL